MEKCFLSWKSENHLSPLFPSLPVFDFTNFRNLDPEEIRMTPFMIEVSGVREFKYRLFRQN